jgi:molybdopterin/thiamine biosynthesis adenylyltransferase
VSATGPERRALWFEREPERRDWELAEFARRGLAAELIERDGELRVKTSLPFRGGEVEVFVGFPFDYPDSPPVVYGPPILERHQTSSPAGGNFCLLEDPASDWWPAMSAAELVDEDLRWLLEDSAQGPEAVAAGEADMPEPVSGYIVYDSGKAMLVPDPFWALDAPSHGGELQFVDAWPGFSWIVTRVDGFAAPDPEVVKQFKAHKASRQVATWTPLTSGIPRWPGHEALLNAALASDVHILRRIVKVLKRERKRDAADGWVAVTFAEEGPFLGEQRRMWAFLRVRVFRKGAVRVVGVVRAQALTPGERARRTPELVGLADACVLVVGAGSLGSPVVLELAKAGVGHVDVVDYDFYDLNNSVRHVVSTQYAGMKKQDVVVFEAEWLNPFVEIRAHDINVGEGAQASARLDEVLGPVDVVVDTTGSPVVSRILQRRCREQGKTLVVAALTAGSFGGEVAVFEPGGPCFLCFVLAQDSGEIPPPTVGPRSNMTPIGCSHPAFSGAGFDATSLAALAARMTVCATHKCSYPQPDHNYVIVNFRGEHPWRQGTLSVRADCPLCA